MERGVCHQFTFKDLINKLILKNRDQSKKQQLFVAPLIVSYNNKIQLKQLINFLLKQLPPPSNIFHMLHTVHPHDAKWENMGNTTHTNLDLQMENLPNHFSIF